MLLIETQVKPSPVHGLGCFAKVRIPKGTIVWQFCPGVDSFSVKPIINGLRRTPRKFLDKYCFRTEKGYLIFADDTRFINCSVEPNVVWDQATLAAANINIKTICLAGRDIEPGEELFIDYRKVMRFKLT
jgi:SET domain-containing protein